MNNSNETSRWFLLISLLFLLAACNLSPTEFKNSNPAMEQTGEGLPGLQPYRPTPISQDPGAQAPADSASATGASIVVRPPTATPQSVPAEATEATGTGVLEPGPEPGALTYPDPIAENPAQGTGGESQLPGEFFSQTRLDARSCAVEIQAYQDHLNSDPYLTTYEAPLVASCYLNRGDQASAISVYETALSNDPDRVTEVQLRQSLAELFVSAGNYPAALAQYDTTLAIAQTEKTQAQIIYRLGQIELLSGNNEAGISRYLTLVNDYPSQREGYQALNELLALGASVDLYQQGLVNYHARAYEAAANAFQRHLDSDSQLRGEAYLYLAWAYEGLGNLADALAQIEIYIGSNEQAGGNLGEAARGRIERARILERAGQEQAAFDDYQTYLGLFPQGEQAPFATWKSALLAESIGESIPAMEHYLLLAETYPDHENAAEALFRAGYLSWRLNQPVEAVGIWQRAIDSYPGREYGAASLLWLLKTTNPEQAGPLVELALANPGQNYYALRARHLALGLEPFQSNGIANLETNDAGRDSAEQWLRERLGLEPNLKIAELSRELLRDARLIQGQKLWQAGYRRDAQNLFESLRADHASDALASYQLALFFRDIGLYRSSILAATSVMSLTGVGVSEAPRFLARLVYPAYYSDFVLTGARTYGYDPLLQLALIREESLFDNLATSALGAQGLAQVLPETGAYIAGQLNWPAYKNGDLYRPSVGIAFGAFFLDQQLGRYAGQVAAALSAYNAGPGYADEWFAQASADFDTFLETVDFPETQRYLKQIYTVHSIYRYLYS